jgi:hypothetical protein
VRRSKNVVTYSAIFVNAVSILLRFKKLADPVGHVDQRRERNLFKCPVRLQCLGRPSTLLIRRADPVADWNFSNFKFNDNFNSRLLHGMSCAEGDSLVHRSRKPV